MFCKADVATVGVRGMCVHRWNMVEQQEQQAEREKERERETETHGHRPC